MRASKRKREVGFSLTWRVSEVGARHVQHGCSQRKCLPRLRSRCSGLGLSRSLDQCRVWGYILGEDRNIQHLLYRNVYEGFEILHPTAFDSFSSLCSAFRTRRLLLWTLVLAEREHPRVCSCSSEHILLFRLDNTCVIYIDNTYRYIVSRYIVLSV